MFINFILGFLILIVIFIILFDVSPYIDLAQSSKDHHIFRDQLINNQYLHPSYLWDMAQIVIHMFDMLDLH